MTDLIIVVSSLITCMCFVIGLTFSVRAHGHTGVLVAIKQLFIILSAISSVIVWIQLGDLPLLFKGTLLLVYILLVWSLAFSYIIGLFGLPLTSLRIQILLTIASVKGNGISLEELGKRYSTRTVVEQRIHRLQTSGEIIKQGKLYKIKSRWSYFMLHNLFLLFLMKLYSPIKK